MNIRNQEIIQVQVVAAVIIGLLVGLILAPWSALLEGDLTERLTKMVGILLSSIATAFLVYLALGLLIFTSWLVDGYSHALANCYFEKKWVEVGGLLGAAAGGIAGVVWVYNHSSNDEYIAFFFGGGLAGLFVGSIAAIIITKIFFR